MCVAVNAAALRSPDDHKLLLQMAQACALALEALRTYAEEHMLALSLQRSFLPDRLPRVPGVALAVRYVPATSKTEIGGDFYEALETGRGLLVAIGDVVGHSLDAAIIMGEVRHALRTYAVESHPPDVILSLLDKLVTRLRPDTFITVTLCLLLVEHN
jgi:serine phosphatase RsbU (regulator of sigma subunit)